MPDFSHFAISGFPRGPNPRSRPYLRAPDFGSFRHRHVELIELSNLGISEALKTSNFESLFPPNPNSRCSSFVTSSVAEFSDFELRNRKFPNFQFSNFPTCLLLAYPFSQLKVNANFRTSRNPQNPRISVSPPLNSCAFRRLFSQ